MPDPLPPQRPPMSTLVQSGWVAFWIALVLPGVILISTFASGNEPSPSLLIVYRVLISLCILFASVWLAMRCFKHPAARVGMTLLFILVLLTINSAIFFVGCLANFNVGLGH